MINGFPHFSDKLAQTLTALHPHTLQVNVGKLCNQACKHCHVDAGPTRTEIMDGATVDLVVEAARLLEVTTVDITGGAPEMNPHFRRMVQELVQRGIHVIDRCNLTVLTLPDFEWVVPFLADNHVEVVASMPYYLEENVDRQRGKGVFEKSMQGLRLLNQYGYGTTLTLNLVYNPQGAYLPPAQEELELIYKRHLGQEYGIHFNNLFTITNMPIARFKHFLQRSGNYQRYMRKLVSSFNPQTLEQVMCRGLISVGWDGRLYDCDFNQMLDLPLQSSMAPHLRHIREVVTSGRPIVVGDHCFGCTAGSGSSCGGSLEPKAAPFAV